MRPGGAARWARPVVHTWRLVLRLALQLHNLERVPTMSRLLKTISIALAASAFAASPAVAQQYSKEQLAAQRKLYLQAVEEVKTGQLAAAETKARQLIRLRPRDPYVRRLLTQVQAERREIRLKAPWQRALESVVVPLIEVDDATLDEVLDYIRSKAIEATGNPAAAPSFVVRGSAAGDRPVTLKLRGVPLSEVLRYAGEMTDVRFSYERYAIVGHDMRPEIAKKTEPEAAGEPRGMEAAPDTHPGVLSFRVPDELDPFLPRS